MEERKTINEETEVNATAMQGMSHCYYLTSAEFENLSSALRGSSLMGALKNMQVDLLSYVSSCHYLPVTLNHYTLKKAIELGPVVFNGNSTTWGEGSGAISFTPNEVKGGVVTGRYRNISNNLCNITVPKLYNNYLDYAPFTTVDLVIPYCPIVSLNPSDVMGKTVSVDVVVDLWNGNILATVTVGGNFLTKVTGNCLQSITLGESYGVGMVASSGYNATNNLIEHASSNSGNWFQGAVESLTKGAQALSMEVAETVQGAIKTVKGLFENDGISQTSYSGTSTGPVDYFGSQDVRIVVKRPTRIGKTVLDNYLEGLPSNYTDSVKNFRNQSGGTYHNTFLSCSDVLFTPYGTGDQHTNPTETEINLIKTYLANGVVVK